MYGAVLADLHDGQVTGAGHVEQFVAGYPRAVERFYGGRIKQRVRQTQRPHAASTPP